MASWINEFAIGISAHLLYFALSIVLIAVFIAIYTAITPYREVALIRAGNTAAAVSLGGALLGFSLPLAQAVEMMSARNAQYLGLTDRGRLALGLRADLNVIDPARLRLDLPQLVRDLPAGGKRFLQTAQGYVGTWVAGQAVAREGQVTTARPGRLVRLGIREKAV